MDRFLIKKRKHGEIDEDESSGATASETRSVTNTQQLPENVEKEKKEINRKFHLEWESSYFVVEYKDRAICLVCRHDFNEFKKCRFERHFKARHSQIDGKFPVNE